MLRRLTILLALMVATASCAAMTGADLTTTIPPSSAVSPAGPSTTTAPPAGDSVPGLAVVPEGGANLYEAPAGSVLQSVHQGIVLPVVSADGSWLEVMDSCSNPAWVNGSEVTIVPKASPQEPGAGFDLSRAVVVLDAGHGGRDWGAPGEGSRESDFNLDIADRLRDLLLSSHDIDWETGTISPGPTYPAVTGAHMTRDTTGPEGGDFEAGLAYRATMANSVAADALLSIHNNTGTDRTLQDPPRAIFYALSVEGSDRLASLIDEELVRSFDAFADEWQGSGVQGTASRRDVDTGGDFYGLLRRSEVPAVIIEGAYVSDSAQNTLLKTTVFRQAYADGVYRGLVRFLTTDEVGSPINEPTDFEGNVGSPTTTNCVVPEQPVP